MCYVHKCKCYFNIFIYWSLSALYFLPFYSILSTSGSRYCYARCSNQLLLMGLLKFSASAIVSLSVSLPHSICAGLKQLCTLRFYLRQAGSSGRAGGPQSSWCRRSSAAASPSRTCWWARFGSLAAAWSGWGKATACQSRLTAEDEERD